MGARGSLKGLFNPSQESSVGAWYRMAASVPVSSEWETVTDVLGGSALVQTDSDRKLAAGASSNGLPIGTYDGTDVVRMPLGSNNFSTSKFGLAYWLRLQSVSSQYLFAMLLGTAGVHVMTLIVTTGGRLVLTIYIGNNVNGRIYTTAASAVTAGVYQFHRVQLDMTKTAECDTDGLTEDAKVRIFINEVASPLTPTDEGAGGTLTTLRTPTGAALFGAANDSDTPSGALDNGTIHGPNTYILLNTPTAAGAARLMSFDAPI